MRCTLIPIFLSLSAASPTSAAVAVHWTEAAGGNGHWYEVVTVPGAQVYWTAANSDAQSRGGYLATVTSEQENAFIVTLLSNPDYWNYLVNGVPGVNFWEGPWIGGYQQPNPVPDIGWRWVSGETFSYTNWAPGLPDDLGTYGYRVAQDHMHYWGLGDVGLGELVPKWDDTNNEASRVRSYIVEYNTNPIPEPGVSILLGASIMGLVSRRYRSARASSGGRLGESA